MLQIARKIGVSTATVSMALRDKGRMSEQTRLKIKATAKALDYQAHPVISQACSLARRSGARNYRETLALITEFRMEEWGYYQRALHEGATERAHTLGYKLEPFLVSGKRSEQRRLSGVLTARGIRGVIVSPRLVETHPRLSLHWENFAAVEVGRTLWSPRNLHHVATADYHKILEALHLLKRVGYKRIGMAVEPAQNHHQRGIFTAVYLMHQSKAPASKRIPPLLSFGPWKEATFRRWLDRYQPDVLYIHHNTEIGPTGKAGHGPWLNNMKLRVPKDISLFCANVQRSDYSGLRRDYVGMGQSAVEMVSLLLGNNSLGLVGNPRSWQVDEIWQPGATLRYPINDFISPDGFLIGHSELIRSSS